jgi:hypothetical protein
VKTSLRIKMNGISGARRNGIISKREAILLKKYMCGCTCGATLRAFEKLDARAQNNIVEERRLRERAAEVSAMGAISTKTTVGERDTIGCILVKSKDAGLIDGFAMNSIKELLSNSSGRVYGVALRNFNTLDFESKIACFRLYPEFKKRALQAVRMEANAKDSAIIEALELRGHYEKWANDAVGDVKKGPLMCYAFSKLDNETQALLASNIDPDDKLFAIGERVADGDIGEGVGELLQKLISLDQVGKDRKAGLLTRKEACCIRRLVQSNARVVRDGSMTARALKKASEATQRSLIPNRRLKRHSTKIVSAKICAKEIIASAMKANIETIRSGTKSSLFLRELEKIRKGNPWEVLIEDERGRKHFLKFC